MHTAIAASHLGKLVDSRYRLQRVVGEGASSWVFAATDQRLEREVALKLFKPPSNDDDLKRRRRCVAEGRTLAKLVHPHIVAIHDASEDGSGQAYLVMELCEAGTLEEELAQRGRLDLSETLGLVLPLLGALAFAHDRNIVHRDIKPGNIVLVEEHGKRRCKLLDFGISLGAGVHMSSDLALGTPAFMAPEQARGEPTTPATDVWALGVVLFRCLAGSLPFEANSPAATLLQIVHGRAPRLSSVCRPNAAPKVLQALDRALEPDLKRRYTDVRSFARALAVTCALDGVAIAQRPEPIGLPEFDAWSTAARDSPTTAPLPVPAAESSGAEVLKARRRRFGKLAVVAAISALIAGGALVLSSDAEPIRAAPVARPPAPPAQPSVGAQAPERVEGVPPASAALPARADVETPRPADPGPKATTAAPLKTPKRKRSDAARPPQSEPAAQAAEPRVIMSWDW